MSDEAHRDPLEPGAVRTWAAVGFAAGVVLLLVVSLGGLYAWFAGVAPAETAPPTRTFPPPRLEAHPGIELNAMLAEQHAALNAYRWADKDHTLIAIPIARAMQIIAARGDQAYAPIESAALTPPPTAGGKP